MWIKRLVVGRPLRSDRLGEQLLSKRLALPVFASDPLSSVAYATQEILLVLTLGGLTYLYLAPWIAVAVVVLLAVVVVSYRQVVRAYPSGGGITALALTARVHIADNACDLVGFPGNCSGAAQRTGSCTPGATGWRTPTGSSCWPSSRAG